MKRFFFPIAAGAVIFLSLSCATADPAKKYPNMVANVDPVSAGVIEAEFDRMFSSKLNKVEIEVVFYPRLNAAALEFRHEFLNYRQFWDEASRKMFADALERYKTDYEARNLVNKYNRTRKIYGKTKGRLEWEAFKLAKTRVSSPTIELGYRFRENSPFFSANMRSALEEELGSGEKGTESQRIAMYFTRSQADDLVRLFDQQYLMGLLGGQDGEKPMEPLVMDEYSEFDD
ncbi:MAG: hypothetical protein FWG46_06785 [Treponema sp.]|nr:hypothetical protein [Treponema sp.]